jgi:hypothetical protein
MGGMGGGMGGMGGMGGGAGGAGGMDFGKSGSVSCFFVSELVMNDGTSETMAGIGELQCEGIRERSTTRSLHSIHAQ